MATPENKSEDESNDPRHVQRRQDDVRERYVDEDLRHEWSPRRHLELGALGLGIVNLNQRVGWSHFLDSPRFFARPLAKWTR